MVEEREMERFWNSWRPIRGKDDRGASTRESTRRLDISPEDYKPTDGKPKEICRNKNEKPTDAYNTKDDETTEAYNNISENLSSVRKTITFTREDNIVETELIFEDVETVEFGESSVENIEEAQENLEVAEMNLKQENQQVNLEGKQAAEDKKKEHYGRGGEQHLCALYDHQVHRGRAGDGADQPNTVASRVSQFGGKVKNRAESQLRARISGRKPHPSPARTSNTRGLTGGILKKRSLQFSSPKQSKEKISAMKRLFEPGSSQQTLALVEVAITAINIL